jgi:hypothetical protein
MVVKFNGKKLQGEATTSQRVLLHHLTGKNTRVLRISKAEASKTIGELLAKSKGVVQSGKAIKFVSGEAKEATISQRVLLARLEHKTNYGEKISFESASKRINKLLGK